MVPPEEGVYRFRYKEDEETPLPILPSVSRGITVTEADFFTLYCEGIAVDENNKTAPDNVMYSDDVLPTPSSLTFGFHGIDPWRQSGEFPVGSAKLKITSNPSIHHMSRLYFFMEL